MTNFTVKTINLKKAESDEAVQEVISTKTYALKDLEKEMGLDFDDMTAEEVCEMLTVQDGDLLTEVTDERGE